jgi:hypothetical protein
LLVTEPKQARSHGLASPILTNPLNLNMVN